MALETDTMTNAALSAFWTMGNNDAVNSHVAGDPLPFADDLVESLLACGALDATPSAAALAAYYDGYAVQAGRINALAR